MSHCLGRFLVCRVAWIAKQNVLSLCQSVLGSGVHSSTLKQNVLSLCQSVLGSGMNRSTL